MCGVVYAQNSENNDEVKTLFGGKEFHSGGYGGLELKVTKVNSEVGLMVGGRGGWIINNTFAIGLGGNGLVTNHLVKNVKDVYGKDTSAYLRIGYGGLILSYINSSNEVAHFTINMLLGAGGASYTSSWNNLMNNRNNFDMFDENSAFFVFEPGLGIELNVTKFFRIELGASYRMISGLSLSKTVDKDVSGLTGNLAFKFGSF
jgi:hypothetical protein